MSLRQQLKAATQPYHDQTEQLPDLGTEFSLANYHRFLLTGWLFHCSLERSLTAFLPGWLKADLQWADRLKTPRITQDLQELGVDAATLSTLPFVVRTIPEALGALYVAEGSTLGGMMMKKKWEADAAVAPHSSFQFLGCYGAQTGAYWKAFISVLESTVTESNSEVTTIASAQATFEFYQKCHQRVHDQW